MTLQSLLKDNPPLIMGILNLTPDSFSDGGSYIDKTQAIDFALQMVKEGADIIDVGGESTRPDAQRVPPEVQLQRVVEVITMLRQRLPGKIPISIDTTRSEVARAAVIAGASIINDVRSGRDDEEILEFAAEKNLPIILMHMQGTPKTMQINPSYEDVVKEVKMFFRERCQKALALGLPKANIIIDPGIGFGKTKDHNLKLMAYLNELTTIGYPVMLGTSRKRFMGAICAGAKPKDLIGATCATTALGVQAGVRIFRVHDIKQNRQAANVAWAIHSCRCT
ncbi:MAG: dihydropteroate synthase [Deltaproteobacteria bacterium]|jgi:dihydropteroate synthase|nr:dihydropteroate synthase [Deltaproteobacteria bacterium]